MVRPMQMEFSPSPGRTGETVLELSNSTTEPLNLALRVVELTQDKLGHWQLIEPGTDADVSKLSSARPWIELGSDSVVVDPANQAEVTVAVNAPADARGTYIAGIIAEQPRPEGATGLVVRVRFLIPVIVQIEGRPVRQEVGIDDVQMVHQTADDPDARTTTAHVVISNEGRTYSRVRGDLRIDRKSGDLWRLVTRIDIPERGIIPGVTLELGGDLQRRLPSGTYRLRADLNVDGRRIPPMEKEIEFKGDPDVDAVAYDTTLILQPDLVEMDVRPGAVRTTAVTIENPGDNSVEIQIGAVTPRSLRGVAMGDIVGESLSAAHWTEIRPSSFTIRPHGRQNVRVISKVPADDIGYANYYADLVLSGVYSDGQSSGETRSAMLLTNKAVQPIRSAVLQRLSLAEGEEPSAFAIQARLVNLGNVHMEPQLRAELRDAQRVVVADASLSGEGGPLLPLGSRDYGAVLDLSNVEPGDYFLRVVGGSLSGSSDNQLIVRVSAEERGAATDGAPAPRTVEILQVSEVAADSQQTGVPEEAADAPEDETQ